MIKTKPEIKNNLPLFFSTIIHKGRKIMGISLTKKLHPKVIPAANIFKLSTSFIFNFRNKIKIVTKRKNSAAASICPEPATSKTGKGFHAYITDFHVDISNIFNIFIMIKQEKISNITSNNFIPNIVLPNKTPITNNICAAGG